MPRKEENGCINADIYSCMLCLLMFYFVIFLLWFVFLVCFTFQHDFHVFHVFHVFRESTKRHECRVRFSSNDKIHFRHWVNLKSYCTHFLYCPAQLQLTGLYRTVSTFVPCFSEFTQLIWTKINKDTQSFSVLLFLELKTKKKKCGGGELISLKLCFSSLPLMHLAR